MAFVNWLSSPATLLTTSPVIPVVVIHDMEKAVPLAEALLAGGINIIEITLRTPVALDVIRLLHQEKPEIIVGAGTITHSIQLQQCIEAGAQFAISPGATSQLLQAGRQNNIPLIPGVTSISELMEGMSAGYSRFKLFPAEIAGGVHLLKTIHGLFPEIRFCPTGGVNEQNYLDYLALPNVECVGGSWVVPEEAIRQDNWSKITHLCQNAVVKAYKADALARGDK
ncbi:bifunctional 4-hydroxy-2-oxoglutarate aldolase/2-dehydro-3-deoxy-phosphogluconate aldolase [Legionella spiritensis]|uniref:bifunctional 4-hydroxy-2-oxoglutarate aldolase/2-dehydro-3-deoxy-phosphogluconate aldolase n=1 Tax=Legionella spiritensis TaxID=452 RepID=UPI000F7206B4|nr:bifunctional 4-hydroxy-2-oxoglutarate aldolase/2-dehydro-3-deoxy-phosphogluconate aldolase [Legionella spiritensis]VEG89689.1 2-deydro-3-deoxyphosphogluconate aldolase/4-hydroxy-2-oxoglutarate aldolase [Legionella spiritensis]